MTSSFVSSKPNDVAFAVGGIASTLVALVVALVLVPDDYVRVGALFYSALALFVGFSVVPAIRATMYGLQDGLRAENFLMLALTYWILFDLLQSTYPLTNVNESAVELALAAVAVMAVGIWTGVAIPAMKLPAVLVRASSKEFSSRQIYSAAWICFFLATFNYAFQSGFSPAAILEGLTASRWDAPWVRGNLGDWSAFIEQLQYFGYVLPSLTVMLIKSTRSKGFNPRIIITIFLSCIFLAFQAQGGGRRIVGVMMGAAILTWLLLNKKISFARVGIVLVLLFGLLNILQTMLYVRKVGLETYLQYGVDVASKKDYFHVDDNFLRLAQIAYFFPDKVEYVGSSQIVFTLIRPIPRALWPGKPVDPGFNLTEMVGMQGVSLSSSIVGELYASWGLIAVFLGGLFMGNLGKAWNVLLYGTKESNNGRLMYALGIMVLFAGIRSMQDLVIMSYSIFAWVFMSLKFGRDRPSVGYGPIKK